VESLVRTEERGMQETPAPVPKQAMNRKVLYAIIAVVLAVVIVGAAAAVVMLTAPAPKYRIDLWYNSDGHYGDTEDELATVLANSIEACGKVDVTLRSDIWTNYRQLRNQGQLGLFLLGWYPDYGDTDDYISPFMASSGSPSFGSFYSAATVDQWIDEEQTSTDPAVRFDRFERLQWRLAEDVPYIPLFSGYSETAYVTGINNVVLHPLTFKWFIVDKPASTELLVSTTDKITSLDPAKAYDFFSIEIINQVFDTLLVYEPVEGRLMPGLATEVPTVANGLISADLRTYTYNLRRDLANQLPTFSDGTELNASVVKRSIDRAIRINDPGGAAFLLYDTGKLGRNATNGNNSDPGAIVVVDEDTIEFHLSAPIAFFNDLMAFSVSAPVPWNYNQATAQADTVGSVIGSGPYRLTGHTPNQQFILERNTGYHTPGLYAALEIPTIPVEDKVTINVRSTSTVLKNDLIASPRLADVVFRTLTPEDITDLQGTSGIQVDIQASPFIRYLVFNVDPTKPAAITDLGVRKAIAYSVDRQAIDRDVFDGNVDPLYSLVPPGFAFSEPYYIPVFQEMYGDGDCESANEIWTALGFSTFVARDLVARDT
jgi:peptide/nickel transport system substrate-binding protein